MAKKNYSAKYQDITVIIKNMGQLELMVSWNTKSVRKAKKNKTTWMLEGTVIKWNQIKK